ncbi:GAF sensor signal transduction histidine kinase [Trichormus variabilis ATCC 29413]|uniref:histidine kinase n=2 Tax=Anabaena variabilis TaxID=264691 RepID=Q3M4Q5_TRIV2|nr:MULTISPECIES: ATP-binding protein [Nostocaceae]ABA24031.1 GAF sensor signal transduction histidine kinase [Trichormus variabilis ATCC 29413]MBC1213223.1 GAF domain-containing protein [Trichormus variabilis ARAD]MBC1256169.1 GAF domain-containing protein [Trichormus variabilis V5]MBC1267370.1 GAF domain-containing protein [Trichormus variabilis FSR]MBC1300706.1 GAF domain-containing protein [Trichormus variabilis N2B]
MSAINLKKIFSKKELPLLLQNLVEQIKVAIDVELVDGTKLLSIGEQTSQHRHSIEVSGEIIGWVVGEEQASIVASLLSFLAKQEAEKKELAKELLERYQEIDLFEDISTQLTRSLDTRQIAQLVLKELSQLMESSAGIILLLSPDKTAFETIAEFGQLFHQNQPQPGQGIIGSIVQSGRAELINNLPADRRIYEQKNVNALICVPLRAKDRILGAIAIGTTKTEAYKAEHLKLVSIFASQTAIAIEKALLYEQSTQATAQAKAQTEKLQQALHELQLAQTKLIQSEKMSSLGQLMAGVAHEINNPVNFICGNLRYVAEYANDLLYLLHEYQKFLPVAPSEMELDLDNIDLEFIRDDLPKLLDSMKVGTDRIVEIVKSLKNFSRHDEAEMKTVNIQDGIDGTLMILRHRLKAGPNYSEIEVVKDYAQLPLIECYPGQLNQVFMNILANAIDALEELRVNSQELTVNNPKLWTMDYGLLTKPQITIRTEALDDQWVVIHIADNGSGIKEDIMGRIYDPFFTTKEVGKGTGLGMAISHQIIVERHHGILKCRSQPGQGTEFWIQIPVNCSAMEVAKEQNRLIPDLKTATLPTPTSELSPTADADGFIPSTTPTFKPTELLLRHTQLIRQLSEQSPGVDTASSEQIYQIFQRNPISLKLYATLLSWFCCSQPTPINHQGNHNHV